MRAICFTFLFLLSFSFSSKSQSFTRCGTNELINIRSQNDPLYLERIAEAANQIEMHARNTSQRFTGDVFRIPVVVHIVYNNEEQNISDEKILQQIEILNQDYRRLNLDASLTRTEFLDVAEDSGIEFVLASVDPNGNPSTGITRTETSQGSFLFSLFDGSFSMKHTSQGGSDAWNVNTYMNIWVCNLSIFGIPAVLGFATPPEGAPNWPSGSGANADEDGVVVHYEVFGPDPQATGGLATVNKGRTATHEVGHFLGLRHIWGDGDCNEDDGLTDTPAAAAASQQTCNLTSNSCTDPGVDLPDMIENYMDYSDESCMNMFTSQQVSAMRFVVENFRQDLLLSNSNKKIAQIKIYPNPVEKELHFEFDNDEISRISVRDVLGRLQFVRENDMNVLDVSSLPNGIYMIEMQGKGLYYVHKFIKK